MTIIKSTEFDHLPPVERSIRIRSWVSSSAFFYSYEAPSGATRMHVAAHVPQKGDRNQNNDIFP